MRQPGFCCTFSQHIALGKSSVSVRCRTQHHAVGIWRAAAWKSRAQDFQAAQARHNQAASQATPPMGVIAPSQRAPVKASA